MTMPSYGELNMGGTSTPVSVAQELGLGLTTTISMNGAAVRTLAGVGGSGTAWSMGSLYGKSNRVVANITISADTQNYVLNTAKVTGYSAGKTDVTLTINSGIYVGSSSTAGIALDVDTSWNAGDKITIINNGYIVGAGGQGGKYDFAEENIANYAGFAGGASLRAQRAVVINNTGTIGGGGGGGGAASGGDTYTANVGTGSGGQGYSGGASGDMVNSGGRTQYLGAIGTKTSGGISTPMGYGGAIAGNGGSLGAAGSSGIMTVYGGYLTSSGGGAGGNCTTAGSNANITWISTGTRLGTIA